MAPFEALYGKRCRTPLCWYQDGVNVLVGPELLQQTTEKIKLIQDRMKASQSRQKSYTDRRRKPLEFEAGDHVFLRVSPIIEIGRAIKAKKLIARFAGPYQIIRRVGPVAYELALPPLLANLHNVFHVSQLKKYILDPNHMIEPNEIQIREDLSYEVIPVRIEDIRVKQLRGKEIPLVKVLWSSVTGDTTWELEDKMRELYPALFSDTSDDNGDQN
ncbi:hypothetical protein VNO78_22245 [Psophocarpus tetragonolobus]|uniref:Tf2-1-like SH3-like domain-containing protein n=1 Tax=Psophocarpus tetragonolobus TaxID=3891 RepID=A0AAN9XI96_PSOTE